MYVEYRTLIASVLEVLTNSLSRLTATEASQPSPKLTRYPPGILEWDQSSRPKNANAKNLVPRTLAITLRVHADRSLDVNGGTLLRRSLSVTADEEAEDYRLG